MSIRRSVIGCGMVVCGFSGGTFGLALGAAQGSPILGAVIGGVGSMLLVLLIGLALGGLRGGAGSGYRPKGGVDYDDFGDFNGE
jgi:hypothetical protein